MQIYISSGCVKKSSVVDNLEYWRTNGFKNIELTGGLDYQSDINAIILKYQRETEMSIMLHNYSPPPKNEFVLNAASLDATIAEVSQNHVKNTIELSRKLKAPAYAFHAGFFIPVKPDELGGRIEKRDLFNPSDCEEVFLDFLIRLSQRFPKYKYYVENNVLAQHVYDEYKTVPFMLVKADDYFHLKDKFPGLNLLLDTGHLKVSCHSLGLDFEEELDKLITTTDYLHISDNNGVRDENKGLTDTSDMFRLLKKYDLSQKLITLEVYDGIDSVKETVSLLKTIADE